MQYYCKVCSVYILFAPLILIIKCRKTFLLQNKFSQTFCIISITLNYQTLCFLEHSGHGLLGRLENKIKQKTFLKNLGFQLFGNCHSIVIFFRTSHFLVTPQKIIMLSMQLHRNNSVNGTNLTGLQLGQVYTMSLQWDEGHIGIWFKRKIQLILHPIVLWNPRSSRGEGCKRHGKNQNYYLTSFLHAQQTPVATEVPAFSWRSIFCSEIRSVHRPNRREWNSCKERHAQGA